MSALSIPAWLPFADRNGRLVWIKLAAFLIAIAPALWMLWQWRFGLLSPKPVTDLLRQTGDWAMRALVLTLAITPLRFTAHWNRLYVVRRMLGVTALAYTLAHLAFWIWQQDFQWLHVLMEMVLRTYLAVGTIATLIMVALGVTSNDWGVQRLGTAGWNRLHWWVYPAAILSLVHYFMLVRLSAWEPSLMAGLLTLSAGFRFLRKREASFGALHLVVLAFAAALGTALIEAGYYAWSTGVNVLRLFEAHLDFSYEVRPAWYVLLAGFALAALRVVRKPAVAAKRAARISPSPSR